MTGMIDMGAMIHGARRVIHVRVSVAVHGVVCFFFSTRRLRAPFVFVTAHIHVVRPISSHLEAPPV